jgi:hypothetical protein
MSKKKVLKRKEKLIPIKIFRMSKDFIQREIIKLNRIKVKCLKNKKTFKLKNIIEFSQILVLFIIKIKMKLFKMKINQINYILNKKIKIYSKFK